MRRLDDIAADGRVQVDLVGADGIKCRVSANGKLLRVIASWGMGWEHVSVSLPMRCPTWEEMCQVRDMFWPADECVMQLHPPADRYVNVHPFCLHLWRPTDEAIPMPPLVMV